MKYLVQRVGAVLTTNRSDQFNTLDEALRVANKRSGEMQHAHIVLQMSIVAHTYPATAAKPKRGRPRKVTQGLTDYLSKEINRVLG
jgi:hypothetical protein